MNLLCVGRRRSVPRQQDRDNSDDSWTPRREREHRQENEDQATARWVDGLRANREQGTR